MGRHITPATEVFGVGSCIELLEAEFLHRYPLFTRHLMFFKYEQQGSQPMSDYMIQCRRMYQEADMDKISGDDLLLYRYLAGTSDKEMRKEILKLKSPTLRLSLIHI